MISETLDEGELSRATLELLEAIIGREDAALAKLQDLVEPEFTGFGPGNEEIGPGLGDHLPIFKGAAEKAGGARYHLLRLTPKTWKAMGVAEGEIQILNPAKDEAQEIYLRFTFVFQHKRGKWKAISGHLSAPLAEQSAGEAFNPESLEAKNAALQQQVREQTTLLQQKSKSLEEAKRSLQATQTQLIQQEKLASLGELTAGIAHEIQNPLNFVNNFSEVSGELLEELQEELQRIQQVPDQVAPLLEDLAQNLKKIQDHGKRADNIVKGMLQHSRADAGEKKETDLNTLADEYLHLAYHGLRARDNTFNAKLTTDFDPRVPKVPVVPQDLGRVLLNLFSNAFYATREKQKTAGPTFQPEVTVSTRQQGSQVELRVRDNGNGIPCPIREKIFQPFFTTKPTGQGTGLGLSLTYDIITKGHGGEVEVDSQEGEYAEFFVRLPII